MAQLIEVAFKGNRKEFFLWDAEEPPALRTPVIVDADRGIDFGRVHATGDLAVARAAGCAHGTGGAPPTRRAMRVASAAETATAKGLTQENDNARRLAMQRVTAAGLEMKVSDAEWQWDRRKLTLYFTSEGRVDFRNLVRELAGLFRTRIELKQIGARDEAKRLDGIGRCGRQYCSASWLPVLRPVNLGVAKDQRLSLNPSQISGACGRLMCCLRYEHDFYVESRRRFPKEGKLIKTRRGEEKVISIDIFGERVSLRTSEGETRLVTLVALREEMETPEGAVMTSDDAHAAESGDMDGDDVSSDEESTSSPTRERRSPEARASETETPGARNGEDGHAVEGRGAEAHARRRRGRRGGRSGSRQDAGGDQGPPPAEG